MFQIRTFMFIMRFIKNKLSAVVFRQFTLFNNVKF